MANCPYCNFSMAQHTVKHIHKKGHCKGATQEEVKEEVGVKANPTKEQPPGLTKQKPTKIITNITDEMVNTYIKRKTLKS